MRLPPKHLSSSSAWVASKKSLKKCDRNCYICRKGHLIAKDCYKNKNKSKADGDAFTYLVEGVETDEVWLADRGATAHMTRFKNYL